MAAVPLADNLALGVVRDDTALAILVYLRAQDGVSSRIVRSRNIRRCSAILALPLVGAGAAARIIISSIITLLVTIICNLALIS